MPQLDLSTYISQVFWLLICFLSLWALLSIFVMPKLADTIEQRKRKIYDYIQKADDLNNQAKKSLNNYNLKLAQAKEQAQQITVSGKEELKNSLTTQEKELSAQLNQKIADNEFLLAKEKKNTLQQIDIISQDLAYEIVQKLGFNSIKKQDIAELAKREINHG